MTVSRKLILAVGFCVVYGAELFFTIRLSTPDGIRLNHPVVGATVPRESVATGDAWMKEGISRIEVLVTDPAGTTTVIPGVRDTAKHRGKPLFALAAWRAKLVFPADGTYTVQATVHGSGGGSVETAVRTLKVSALARSTAFVFGSPPHLAAIAVIVAIAVLLPIFVRRSASIRARDRGAVTLSLVLLVHEVVFQVYWFLMQNWTVVYNLTLHMCSLAVMIIPVMFFTANEKTRQYLFEIMYFWGLGGAVQALFSPDIGLFGFPMLKYFNYFISHGAIIIAMVYAAVLYPVTLTWKSWLRIAVVTNVALLAAWGFNLLLRFIPPYDVGNYFAMGYPPPNGSIIDLFSDIFGPSPRYAVALELMGVALLGVLYLPYPILRRVRRAREDREAVRRASR